ncbi:S8 family serine peptidase [Agromyces humatus]|uniref:S8 family serine peptidase n=1 Tax=Agromyces humatus TaxID=279573 RepID=A0ABN2KQ53_9MICO|nr:S8 family serine peptidase [Agromyces humatus]
MRPRHIPRALAILATVTALVVGLTAPAAADAAEPPDLTQAAGALGETHGITLLTGDRVEVAESADGRRAATVTPGPGREQVTFQTIEVDGVLQVLPSDAIPFLASGVIDDSLFEVSTLIEEGYADLEALPLIVSWSPGVRAEAMAVAGAEQTRALPSIDGAALSAGVDDLGQVWAAITGGAVAEAPANGSSALMAGGIERVWLDGRASASLDQSVRQIGAPDAWEAGYRGTGIRVAVLDTGVDGSHPDLVGQVEEAVDFTGSETGTADLFGHGTHVAATIAGTGAGAGGARPGVAPDADLMIGKVLSDDGYGYDSWIIAGMEWAAERAAVVNMSLGGGPSDGTDPLSLSLDALSEQTGALFVVAAGNDGTDEAVSTPSTAPAALSVAAVDRDESLAEFSSRGPRTGDGGLKPEISGPGVGIVAARASGTAMGSPVDALYTASSGTSMATPHVAGAAVLLAQQHPDWTGERLKDALVSTSRANPDLGVYEQGAGRVDVARAVSQQVTATGIADFALQGDAVDDAVRERTVTYRNEGDEPVTLDLAIEAANPDDPGSSTRAFSAPEQVTVPAHGSAEVDVAIDQSALDQGRWSGALIATAQGDVLVRSAIGAVKRGPRHTVTIRAVGFDGGDTFVPSLSLIGDRPGTEYLGYLDTGEVATLEVEEGDYVVQGIIEDFGNAQAERTGTVILPDLEVTSDVEVVIDARTTRPIEIRTPERAEQQGVLSWYAHRLLTNGRDIQHGVMSFERTMPWVTPTDPVREGEFEFSSRWQLVRPSALITLPGTELRPQAGLLMESAVLDRALRLELVAPGPELEGVSGKVVVVDAPDQGAEVAQVEAAAAAGARAIILVRPATNSIFTVFEPGFDPGPIPAMVTTAEDGAALIRHAQQPGKQQVVVEASRTSPYLYDVMQVSTGAIPDEIVHRVTEANSHLVTTTYVESGGRPYAREQRFGWRPWMTYSWNDAQRTVATGESRVEWVSAGDSVWQHRVLHTWDNWIGTVIGGMAGPALSYEAGRSKERWFDPVVRPAAIASMPSTRSGDRMQLRVPELVDGAGHADVGGVSSSARLYRDGELVESLPNARQALDVIAEEAEYRLELDVARDDAEWQQGVRSSTAWTFRSGRPDEGATETLPLLQVVYDVPTDDEGQATSRRHTVSWQVTDQLGAVRSRATLQAEVSFDDGANWQSLAVRRDKDGFSAVVPAGSAPVTLRVTAVDGSSTVTQEVVRAYARG